MSKNLLKIEVFCPVRKLWYFCCRPLYLLPRFADVAGVADFCLFFFSYECGRVRTRQLC